MECQVVWVNVLSYIVGLILCLKTLEHYAALIAEKCFSLKLESAF